MDKIAVVGLGYVGLPLAVAFGKKRDTIGYDLDERKLTNYRNGSDPSGEVEPGDLAIASHLEYTSDPTRLAEASIIVVAVPTPIDHARKPDLSPVIGACRTLAANLKPGATVVFESTVYPGCTEEVCVPIIEQVSGMPWAGREGTDNGDRDSGFYIATHRSGSIRATRKTGLKPLLRWSPGIHRLPAKWSLNSMRVWSRLVYAVLLQ